MSENEILLQTDLPLPLFIKGKVRDSYDLGDTLLFIATDRISAFDVVMPNGIPRKGRILNQISAFWFEQTAPLIPNHQLEVINDVSLLDNYLPADKRFDYPEYLAGRSMLVKKFQRLPVECIVRGYLAGSAWEEYQKSGTIFGEAAPKGLRLSDPLPEPMFTPTTKAESGHDEPMNFKQMSDLVGKEYAEAIREKSLEIYRMGQDYARQHGIIIADTKLEFGLDGDKLVLIDEVLTPDSSRFWKLDWYQPGKSQPGYDKQPVRDWLAATGWDKTPPAPALSEDIIRQTTQRYEEVYEQLTGRKLA